MKRKSKSLLEDFSKHIRKIEMVPDTRLELEDAPFFKEKMERGQKILDQYGLPKEIADRRMKT